MIPDLSPLEDYLERLEYHENEETEQVQYSPDDANEDNIQYDTDDFEIPEIE